MLNMKSHLSSAPWSEELAFARHLADIADKIALKHLADSSPILTKSDNSLVTAADLEIQGALLEELTAHRPHDIVAAEEGEMQEICATDNAVRLWAIDPIDHTNNYARGLPVFGTLVSLLWNSRPVVGVISAPAIGKRWWGA
jgi:histidinol-phosphatase